MKDALQKVTAEIEHGTAKLGWDRPPALYALVKTSTLLGQPDLPPDIAQQVRAEWDGGDNHLSAILQEQMPEDNIEEMLPRLAWPEDVLGAVVCVERVIVPPEVEQQAPDDEDAAIEFISNHPQRTEVRLVVSALRSGETWSMIRARDFDADETVASGDNLVPQLAELLTASLTPDHD